LPRQKSTNAAGKSTASLGFEAVLWHNIGIGVDDTSVDRLGPIHSTMGRAQ
jgi:hypothetical protein